MNRTITIFVILIISATILITFSGVTYVSGLEKIDIIKKYQNKLENTFYIEYEQDFDGVEITSLHLYPTIIKVGEHTRLSIGLENHENEIKNFFIEVLIQNDPEFWTIEETLSPLPMTYDKYQSGELQIIITSNDSAGTYLTEIFEIKVYDENMILIDQQNIPIKSTANWEWVN